MMRRLALVGAGGLLAGCTTLRAPADTTAPPGGPAGNWAAVLQCAVDGRGRVDFAGLAARPAGLDAVVSGIAAARPDRLSSRAALIAFHINAYNALAMYGVVRDGIPQRLSLLDRIRFFKLTRFVVGGRAISLYDYENDVIRPLGEARVHFALNCMAVSCPRLPRTPFTAAGLDAELDQAARRFFAEPRNATFQSTDDTLLLSAILDFYTEDFSATLPALPPT